MTLKIIEHYVVDAHWDESGFHKLDYPLLTHSRTEKYIMADTIEECFDRCRKLNDRAKNCNWHYYEFADKRVNGEYNKWLANEKRKESA